MDNFCGECGADQKKILAANLALVATAIETAERLRASGEGSAALAALRDLPNLKHPEIQQRLDDVQRLQDELRRDRSRREEDVQTAMRLAEKRIEEKKYQEALEILNQIPKCDRTEPIEQLIHVAAAAAREIRDIQKTLTTLEKSRKVSHFAPYLDRLLSLQPNDERARTLAHHARDVLAKRVVEALRSTDYELAKQLVDCIPLAGRNESTERLQSTVREIHRLRWELRNAPHVDDGLLAIAERICSLTPGDHKLFQVRAETIRRIQRESAREHSQIKPWAIAKTPSYLGPDIEWLGNFRRLKAASSEIDQRLRLRNGEYYIAAGLALQGIAATHIPLNLLPKPRASGLLSKLAGLRKHAASSDVWGLDVGQTGIKAVRLALSGPGDQYPVISACDTIPYQVNLSLPERERVRGEVIRCALEEWRDRYRPTEQEKICVSCPAEKTLGRFLQLPKVARAKLDAIIHYEVAQRLPVSLSDLSWDVQYLDGLTGCHAVVAALRLRDAIDQLQLFEQLGLVVQVLQPAAIALHNFIRFDGLPGSNDRSVDLEDVGVIEMGSGSSTLLVTNADSLWFRTLRFGGNDISLSAARHLRLTFEQAELVKRKPPHDASLIEWLSLIDQSVARFVDEIQRSVDAFRQERPERKIGRLYLMGGGARQFGLLRHLCKGPFREGV